MKICFLTPTFLPKLGGVEIVVSSLANQFHVMGHCPCVVTQWPRRGKGTVEDRRLDYPVVRYPRPWSFTLALGMRSIHKALEHAYRQQQFDLIHCHLVYPVGFMAVRFAKPRNIPVIITAHGSDIRTTSRYRRRNLIWRRIVRCLKEAQLVTAISDDMQQVLSQIIGKGPVPLIPNGVDVEALTQPVEYQSSWPIQPNGEYVLYLGGLTAKKGVDVLLKAMGLIRQRRLPANLKLIVAGEGSQRPVLQQYASDHDLASAVQFVGPVAGDFKRFLLQHCQYVVMPSRTEAMPLVALEAFAAGKPILASNVGGLAKLIRDGVTGRLIAPENPSALADAMTDFTAADREPMRANAQSEAAKYSWSTIAEKYLAAYESVLARA